MVSRNDGQEWKSPHQGGGMRSRDSYVYIGYTPSRVSCRYKVRYLSPSDAESAAYGYNQRILFGNVGAYWCELHTCWHIGHRDKYHSARLKLRENVAWFRMWHRRN